MTLNIAMIGTGKIAENALAPALKQAEGGQLWSVMSRDASRANEFAKRHGAQSPNPAYDDLQELLSDPELDAIILATPDALHASQTIAAAKAAKHVLCEKPLATQSTDARAMVQACAENNVKLATAYHMRWHAGHRRLHQACQAGDFGELRHMRLQWSWYTDDASNWRASAEVGRWWSLAGVGTHMLDQIRWFMLPTAGEVVDLSSIIARQRFGGPHDETAVVALRFESGATAELCSSVMFEAPRRMEVYGTKNYAICENTLGLSGTGKIWTRSEGFDFEVKNPYRGEIEDFISAIREDRPAEVGGEEAARNVDLLLRAIE